MTIQNNIPSGGEVASGGIPILGRPSWELAYGSIGGSPRRLERLLDAIGSAMSANLPLILEHTHYERKSVVRAALTVFGRLRDTWMRAELIHADTDPRTDPGMAPAEGCPYVILDAPRLAQIQEFIQGRQRIAPLVLCGENTEWEKLEWARGLPRIRLEMELHGKERGELARVSLDALQQRLSQFPREVRELYRVVAAFDAFGTPVPRSLLEKMGAIPGDIDFRELLTDSMVIFPVDSGESSQLICTAGEALAQLWLAAELGDDPGDFLVPLLARAMEAAKPSDPLHRHCLRLVCTTLTRKARRRWLQQLAEMAPEGLMRMWTTHTAEPHELIGWATALAEAWQFPLAEECLDLLVSNWPRPDTWHARAHLYLRWVQEDSQPEQRARRLEKCRRSLEHLPEDNPYRLHTQAELSLQVARRGGMARPMDVFGEVIRKAGGGAGGIQILASAVAAALEEHRPTQADDWLKGLKALAPRSLYTAHLAARLAEQKGQFREAEEGYAGILAQEPWNLPTLTAWAALARNRRHFARARTLLDAALVVDRENLFVRHGLGELWMEEELFTEAENAFQDILRDHPNHVPALVSLARLYARRFGEDGNTDWYRQARERIDQAHYLDPGSPLVRAARRDTYMDLGIGNVLSSLDPAGNDCAGMQARGREAAMNKNYREAVEFYNQALKLARTRIEEIRVLNALSERIFDVLGPEPDLGDEQNEELLRVAERGIEQALEWDRQNGYTLEHRGWALHLRGREQEATASAKLARKLEHAPAPQQVRDWLEESQDQPLESQQR